MLLGGAPYIVVSWGCGGNASHRTLSVGTYFASRVAEHRGPSSWLWGRFVASEVQGVDVTSAARRYRPSLSSTAALRFVLDIVVWGVCSPAAIGLAIDRATISGATVAQAVVVMLLVKIAAEATAGNHKHVWARIAFPDAVRLAIGIGAAEAVWIPLAWVLRLPANAALQIIIVECALAWTALLGMRLLRRYQAFGAMGAPTHVARVTGATEARVLLVGAGEAGSLVAREMLLHPELGSRPVGFVDDNPRKLGSLIAGLPVLGSVDKLADVCGRYRVDEVVASAPSQNGTFIRRIKQHLDEGCPAVRFKTMPGIYELIAGNVSISRLRDVDTADLLRREPVALNEGPVAAYLQGQTVLVTGGGGSIGSELARQVAKHRPAKLVLLGRGENSIFHIGREIAGRFPDLELVRVIADVRERGRLFEVFRRHAPDVVFHAAAHKHVGLMEENPEDAVLNNVLGTRNVVDAVLAYGVKRFVNISTDKAVRPTSVMGATKRMAESLVKAAAGKAGTDQKLVSVRFGNVLGSRGSVVPLFLEQIRKGGPVNVTHAEMKRYFMTIPEASALVLQAGALADNGAVYILDMGDPVRIVDLASDLIRLSGLEPDVDVPIVFTGAKPGEKMFEELITDEEREQVTTHDKIVMARMPSMGGDEVVQLVDELAEAAHKSDTARIRRLLRSRLEESAVAAD